MCSAADYGSFCLFLGRFGGVFPIGRGRSAVVTALLYKYGAEDKRVNIDYVVSARFLRVCEKRVENRGFFFV